MSEAAKKRRKAAQRAAWQVLNRDHALRMHNLRRKIARLEGRPYGGKRKARLDALLLKLKSKPCTDCRRTFPACCMDFDHRDGDEKIDCVGTMFAHHHSIERIMAEVAKCDLICSNCHRIRTAARREAKRIADREEVRLELERLTAEHASQRRTSRRVPAYEQNAGKVVAAATRTHCRRDHPMDAKNTYICVTDRHAGLRKCRTCAAAAGRALRKKRNAT